MNITSSRFDVVHNLRPDINIRVIHSIAIIFIRNAMPLPEYSIYLSEYRNIEG